jgi:hypothetical protein
MALHLRNNNRLLSGNSKCTIIELSQRLACCALLPGFNGPGNRQSTFDICLAQDCKEILTKLSTYTGAHAILDRAKARIDKRGRSLARWIHLWTVKPFVSPRVGFICGPIAEWCIPECRRLFMSKSLIEEGLMKLY